MSIPAKNGFLTRVTLITCLPIDCFYTYREINDGSALLGNNITCVTIETQKIKSKLHDGMVRTLSKVRHIPDLRKNLISLSILHSNGCKYTTEGGVIKVVKVALVHMKGKKVKNLYKLSVSTITGGVAMFSSNDSDSNLTRL